MTGWGRTEVGTGNGPESRGRGPQPTLPSRSGKYRSLLFPPNLGRYHLRKVIGRGGMGMVALAYDPMLDRTVALKVLLDEVAHDEAITQRFLTEARAIAQVEHPNVVRIHDAGTDGQYLYFAMELIDGRTAEEAVQQGGPMSVARAIDTVRQAALGLQAAHARGIVHRDVKPSNMLVDGSGRVRVVDFGIADAGAEGPGSAPDIVVGTPGYMAPEAVAGACPDHLVDIYALGGTLHYLLTGHPPFEGETTTEIFDRQRARPVPDVREVRGDVSPELAGLLARLLAKAPPDRPRTWDAVIADLGAIAGDLVEVPPVWRSGARPPGRLPGALAVLFAPAAAARASLDCPSRALSLSYLARIALAAELVALVLAPATQTGATAATIADRLATGWQALVVCYAIPLLATLWCLVLARRPWRTDGLRIALAQGAGAGYLPLLALGLVPRAGRAAGVLAALTFLRVQHAVLSSVSRQRGAAAWALAAAVVVLVGLCLAVLHLVVPGMLPALLLGWVLPQ